MGARTDFARVDAFLTAAGEGLRTLVVAGPAGIGKTTVWHEAVRVARDQGCRVLVARASGAEARLSFAGLADLLADVDGETMGGLPEPQRQALDVALLRARRSVHLSNV